jgi:3',5'-cyclic AMP phosphodiesterase CpdA
MTFGVVGDLGQTQNSTATVDALARLVDDTSKAGPNVLLHAGDLAYADGNGFRWDTYARMGEVLWSKLPAVYVGGNHEVASGGENWMSYKVRYPNQHEKSGSASFLYHSLDAGPVHVVALCSYLDFESGGLQYTWLENDLKNVDRTSTPWIVAMFHTPWYTSNAHHPMSEGTAMREAMEPLFHKYRVNIVFNGHVHAYERTAPVFNDAIATEYGTTHITIGDGGNREMYATPWVTTQPDWSEFREFAYGFGQLTIVNATTAKWQWTRSSNTSADPRDHDSATIVNTMG